jgi:D-lactate dehydrogenase (cytochrome)
MMAAINKAGLADRKYPELDSLFFKFQGSKESQREASATVKKIVEMHGGYVARLVNLASRLQHI